MSPGATSGRRPGRPTAGQAPLTVDRILTTALAFVDEHGLEKLSMRRLARELDVDPMSIYHHLPSKAAVVCGLVERVFTQIRLPAPDDSDWTEQVRDWVHAYYELTRTHPHLVLKMVSDPAAVIRAGELIGEPLQASLAQAGLPPDKIDACEAMIVDYVNGYALAEIAHSRPYAGQTMSSAGLDSGLDVMLLGIQALAAQITPR
jgi:TetR/AcrR family tetracycline transcriptional repressor